MSNDKSLPFDGPIPKKISLPPQAVDCSAFMAGLPPEEWTRGTFVNRKISHPPIKVDCSRWTGEPAIWLEVSLSHKAAGAALPSSAPFLDAARTLAPELNLVADAGRTRRDGDTFILALTPTAALDDIEERLTQLIRQARSLSVGGARVTSAALCWAA